MQNLSIRSIFLISEAIAELITNDKIPRPLAELRLSAILSIHAYLQKYLNLNLNADFVDAVCEKKIGFIMQANSSKEIREIMRPALPEKTYSGIVCRSPYHIPAEELLLWNGVTPYCKMIPEVDERCLKLFEQAFGMSIDEYMRRNTK